MLEFHHSRRLFHLLPGLLIIAISYVVPPYPIGTILLTAVTAIFYYAHVRRSDDREYDIWYLKHFGKLLREEEIGEWVFIKKNNKDEYKRKSYPIPNGALYWILGTTLSSALFSQDISRTALLVLSASDPFAAYVGVWFTNYNCNITWSRLWSAIAKGNRGKKVDTKGGPTVVGSFACALATLLCTYVYFPYSNKGDSGTPILTLSSRSIVSIATAFVEAVAGRMMIMPIDDNLLIPLVVGGLITWLVEL
ncbi:hypothetical protein ACHAWO_012621 [Cyclotella atomus]|uniref:Dolichol kinase n=1 Tax=Cyclotella atomus TaxID=382360 RepID=A0ABD3PJS7_9STRA